MTVRKIEKEEKGKTEIKKICWFSGDEYLDQQNTKKRKMKGKKNYTRKKERKKEKN